MTENHTTLRNTGRDWKFYYIVISWCKSCNPSMDRAINYSWGSFDIENYWQITRNVSCASYENMYTMVQKHTPTHTRILATKIHSIDFRLFLLLFFIQRFSLPIIYTRFLCVCMIYNIQVDVVLTAILWYVKLLFGL